MSGVIKGGAYQIGRRKLLGADGYIILTVGNVFTTIYVYQNVSI